jgi:hypothetical protein
MEKRRLSTNQMVTLVVAVCAAIVLAPVTVMAATGSLVNITDPVHSSYQARVGSTRGLWTTMVDPNTGVAAKVEAGAVRVADTADRNAVVYQTPTGGLDCGADINGFPLGTRDLSRYSRLRIMVQSGPSQTIVRMTARAGSDTIQAPWFNDYQVPANTSGTIVVDALPTLVDVRVFFCTDAKIFLYGIR